MNDPSSPSRQPSAPPSNPVLFSAEPGGGAHPARGGRNLLPWIVAAVVICILVVLTLIFGGRRATNTSTARVDPYAAQLAISNVHLSQATNFAGDQLTYVDGTVGNHGDRTVTAITVRVVFANNDGEQPQVKRIPLSLIRTREPYVDTQPVSAAPLKPGASQDFRLIFDDISPLWNQQIPTIEAASVVHRQ
ncbi:MAG: DUF2393 family protein [Acidobacteriaceae bacterium]